jgi:hypothetical protein
MTDDGKPCVFCRVGWMVRWLIRTADGLRHVWYCQMCDCQESEA